jgi:hypothetical protein
MIVDMQLCNMFLIIKDNIDSLETLLKLMRRLKMPKDKVELVCKEIVDNVNKNWNQLVIVEYPFIPGQLRPNKRELLRKKHEYILKLQAWNLLNMWRNMNGENAQSDELLRIFKLMNSSNLENNLLEKLISSKNTSNMLRV